MNEYAAAALIGDCVRGLHQYTTTPEKSAVALRPAMTDAVNVALINARITSAIRCNQDAIAHCRNRIASLNKLQELISLKGSEPVDAISKSPDKEVEP